MPTLDVPIADADIKGTQRRLKQEIDKLEKQGIAIIGLRVPESAGPIGLGFTPHPVAKNAYQYGNYTAVKK